MEDNDWYIIAGYSVFTALTLIVLFLKLSRLLALMCIVAGIIGILASIFKWEDVLFYNHFWIDLDENLWFRILNAIIGGVFIAGGLCAIAFHIDFWK